jgi:hypothetical protein
MRRCCKLFSKTVGGWKECIMRIFLYSSSNVIRMIKSRRMTWTVHVALMGEKNNAYGVLVVKRDGK